MGWFYGEPMNDRQLSLGFGQLDFVSEKCDLSTTLYIEDPYELLETDPLRFAKEYGKFIGYHANTILPELNGFQGYDCLQIKVVKSVKEERQIDKD